VPDRSQNYACKRSLGTAQRNLGLDLTEQRTSHVTLIILITVTIVRISLVYRKTRSLLCSCVQLIVHSDCLVYNNTKPLLQYFVAATCPLHRVQTQPLSHLTSHSRDGSHLGSQDPNTRLKEFRRVSRSIRPDKTLAYAYELTNLDAHLTKAYIFSLWPALEYL
jgi:hypothetical protein